MAFHSPQARLVKRPLEVIEANDQAAPSEKANTPSGPLPSATAAQLPRTDKTMKRTTVPSASAATTTTTVTTSLDTAIPRGFKWTPQDVFCSSLFGPWDDLPTRSYEGNTPLLRDLDRVITLFDARIQHSDVGFRAWRARHKQAMEVGLAEIPGFPALRRKQRYKQRQQQSQKQHRGGGGAYVWQDDMWEQRYHYLIYQRHRMILARLDSRFMLTRRDRDAFFGKLPAPKRETLKSRPRGAHTQPLELRDDWYMPLDFLLERAAREWNMDTDEVKSQFWRDEVPALDSNILEDEDEVMEDLEGPPACAATDMGKAKEEMKSSTPRCGKMDLAFLLEDPTQMVHGSRGVPHVSLEGQVSW